MLAIPLLPAGSLGVLGKEELPHVNDPHVHVLLMLLTSPDLVLALDVDKILAGNARILERLYIVGDVHRSEHVVGAVDKPGETLARPCARQ